MKQPIKIIEELVDKTPFIADVEDFRAYIHWLRGLLKDKPDV